jgi:hypothetical protein
MRPTHACRALAAQRRATARPAPSTGTEHPAVARRLASCPEGRRTGPGRAARGERGGMRMAACTAPSASRRPPPASCRPAPTRQPTPASPDAAQGRSPQRPPGYLREGGGGRVVGELRMLRMPHPQTCALRPRLGLKRHGPAEACCAALGCSPHCRHKNRGNGLPAGLGDARGGGTALARRGRGCPRPRPRRSAPAVYY